MNSCRILWAVLLSAASSIASAQFPDKQKVGDLFQNQQFEEAIAYLTPFYSEDSVNMQILSDLGYAQYMDDKPRECRRQETICLCAQAGSDAETILVA